MENYTKYKLKSRQELEEALAPVNDLFVIGCNKCFKEFQTESEPECNEFTELAKKLGKNVTGSMQIDFACNKVQTARKLADAIPDGTACVFAVSCGLGIQTIADIVELPVFAACDSIPYNGHHGMALTDKACDACAQCYLNLTGGICPIVDCSKSLVNGQCGGARDGKCEVDSCKDCAWEKIQQRLARQGRLEELTSQPVQLRDYSKVNFKAINEYVQAVRASRFEGYYGGVHPLERKERTEHMPIVRFPEPETVVIPLSQHAGAPANCLVAVGDAVQVGQKIGEAAGFISANVHASVSGKVVAIEERPHPGRGSALAVVIENDKKNTVHESVKPQGSLEDLSPAQIAEIVHEAGIVGMGGACFPTSVKLKPNKPIDTVLLNGCECEPLLTADHRVLLEYADDVLYGLKAMVKAVGAEKGIIVIEDNKMDAVALLQEKTADIPQIGICVAKTKYPQGAEKMLIKRVMNRKVPSGGLPADVGCVVANVSTAKAVSDAIQTGMPLVERVVTVTGESIVRPGNFLVKIGTGAQELINYCGGIIEGHDPVVRIGGVMMGAIQKNAEVPILKGGNGVSVFEVTAPKTVECIKCGRCVDVCPMELQPLHFAKYAGEGNWEGCKKLSVMDCLECGCCSYICSSKIDLVSSIRAAKAQVRGMK